ncbi:MAG: GNAT family N-acetyltransferase [Motilibacteraceae bacterium]
MTSDVVVLRTDRLLVRDWRADEAERHFDLYRRPEVVRFLGSTPTPMPSAERAAARIERVREFNAQAPTACGWWAVEVAATGVVAGTIAVLPIEDGSADGLPGPDDDPALEVAWHLHPDSQGQGYAVEAARGVLDRAHGLGVREVLALVDPANAPSLAVARRLGLAPLGVSERYYGKPLEVFVSRAEPTGGRG